MNERIKTLRASLSILDASVAIGCSPATLRRWEAGTSSPGIEDLARIAVGLAGESMDPLGVLLPSTPSAHVLDARCLAVDAIGSRLRRARGQRSRSNAAHAAGVTDGTMQRYESGAVVPPVAVVAELAELHGESATYLMGFPA